MFTVRHRILLGSFLFLSLYSGALYALATTYVAPGATLDPSGLPGSYTVGPLLSYGEAVTTSHDNEILYVDDNGDLGSDSNFYRNSDGTTGIVMSQNGGADETGIMIANSILGIPGTDGILMRKSDTGGTVGSAILGLLDPSPLGAPTDYAIFGRVEDIADGTAGQLILIPQFVGLSWGDGIENNQFTANSGGVGISTDNADGGGSDEVAFVLDLNGGSGLQEAYIGYSDGTDDYRVILGNTGIRFDFDDGNATTGLFYRFPVTDGTNGQVLQTDGLGMLSWATISGGAASAAGSQYEIQFNDGSGVMDADPDFTWNGVRLSLESSSSDHSVYIGPSAGSATPTAASHVAIGYTALQSIAGATMGNTAVGAQALASVTVAQYNTAVGYASGDTLSGGGYNVYLGAEADVVGAGTMTPSYNTVVGASAKTYQNGSYNTLLGYDTGSGAYAGYNTIIGAQSGNDVGMSSYNVLLGYDVEMATTSIAGSVGIGKQAIISASNQFALADSITQMKLRGINYTLPSADGPSGYVLTTDGSGILSWESAGGAAAFTIDGQTMYAGTSSGSSLDPGVDNNLFIGYSAGRSVTSGFQNTLLGAFAGDGINTGASNTFIGNAAGLYVTSGDENVFIGNAAGMNQLAVDFQIAIGSEALKGSPTTTNNTGTANIAIGNHAGYSNTSGSNNYTFGSNAGGATTTGGDNIFIGYSAGASNTTGGYNVALGHYTNTGDTNVEHGIVIGYDSTLDGYGGSIVFGSQATATATNQFVAGSPGHPISDIYFGSGALDTLTGTAQSATIHGTGANSTSTNGGDLILAGGSPFAGGTSLGGSLVFKTAQDFSSAALQTRMTIDRFGTVHIGETDDGGARPFLNVNTNNAEVINDTIGLNIFADQTNTTTDSRNKMGLRISTSGDFSGGGGSGTAAFGIYINTTTGADTNYDIYAQSGAYLSTSGTWTNASSRTLKENFVEVSGGSVLDKLQTLSIYEWNYLTDSPSIVHIGPVAEEFKQVFGYGQDNKSISTIDPAGIALAAIKELDLRVRNLANLSSTPASIADQLVSMAVRVKDLVVGSREYRTGITMYDEVTGDPYCLSIANGAPKTVSGECVGVIPEEPQNTTPQDSGDSIGDTLTGNSDQGSGGDEGVTTEEDPPETQTSTSSDPQPSNTGDVQ